MRIPFAAWARGLGRLTLTVDALFIGALTAQSARIWLDLV